MGESRSNEPGVGAEHLASRAARRAARLREEQAMGRGADGAVDAQLAAAVRRQRTYSQGAEGERLVAHTLGFVERYGWVALHDVRWPGRPQANIDHVAVGPGGVVVIDAKNWTGDVAVRSGVLRQNGYSRERETTAAATATSAVAARLAPQHRTAVQAVLCLVAQDLDTTTVGQTAVVGRSRLGEHLVGLPVRFSAYDVADVARFLAADLGGTVSPDVLTTAALDAAPARQARPPRRRAPRSVPSAPAAPRPAARRPSAPRGRRRSARAVLLRIVLVMALVALAPRLIPAALDAFTGAVTSVMVPAPTP